MGWESCGGHWTRPSTAKSRSRCCPRPSRERGAGGAVRARGEGGGGAVAPEHRLDLRRRLARPRIEGIMLSATWWTSSSSRSWTPPGRVWTISRRAPLVLDIASTVSWSSPGRAAALGPRSAPARPRPRSRSRRRCGPGPRRPAEVGADGVHGLGAEACLLGRRHGGEGLAEALECRGESRAAPAEGSVTRRGSGRRPGLPARRRSSRQRSSRRACSCCGSCPGAGGRLGAEGVLLRRERQKLDRTRLGRNRGPDLRCRAGREMVPIQSGLARPAADSWLGPRPPRAGGSAWDVTSRHRRREPRCGAGSGGRRLAAPPDRGQRFLRRIERP